MTETDTNFDIASLVTGIESGSVTIEDEGPFESEENDIRSIKITRCENAVTNIRVCSTKSSPAKLKLAFYKGKVFLEEQELSYTFLNEISNENYKKLVKAIIDNNITKDAETKGMGRVLAETAILVDQDTKPEIEIFHTRLGEGIAQSTFKEDLAGAVKKAKEDGKLTAHILVSCRGHEDGNTETVAHTVCLSVNTERFNENGKLNQGEKLQPSDYLITDSSGVTFNWFKDKKQPEFQDIRDMMNLSLVQSQTYTFNYNSIQIGDRCSEFAGCAYQVLSRDEYSNLSLSDLIKKKKELACDIACKVEHNYVQATKEAQENINIRKLDDSEKDSTSVPEGYARINFEEGSSYLVKCRFEQDRQDQVKRTYDIGNLLKVIGGNNLSTSVSEILNKQIPSLTCTVYIDGHTKIEPEQREQANSPYLTQPRPEDANMMSQDTNQTLPETIPEESLESPEDSVKSRPQVELNLLKTSPVIKALNFKKKLPPPKSTKKYEASKQFILKRKMENEEADERRKNPQIGLRSGSRITKLKTSRPPSLYR